MSIVAETQPSRQGYASPVICVAAGAVPARSGEVQPEWFGAAALVQSRAEWAIGVWVGTWLDCRFPYSRPGAELPYLLSVAVFVTRSGQVSRVYLRSCSCPDGLKRAEQTGSARHCKHMVALRGSLLAVADVAAEPLLWEAWETDQAQYAAM